MLPVSTISFKKSLAAFRRKEDGAMIFFSLCMFIVLIMITGLALDLMRFETKRAHLQGTLDRASLAAASLDQELDPAYVVEQYFAKAGLTDIVPDVDVEEEFVGGDATGEGGELVSRQVTINADLELPTLIMHMMGHPVLKAPTAGVAKESIQNVEISLVLDVSGSMGSNNRLVNLKDATKEFIEAVIDEERTEGITTMSIIPYNGYVVVPDVLLERLEADPESVFISLPDDAYPELVDGYVRSFPDQHSSSNCIRFRREGPADTDRNDFKETAITQTQRLERVAHFDEGGSSGYSYSDSFNSGVPDNKSWCPGDTDAEKARSQIMLPSADISDLQDKITALKAGGWTGVDNGVKWGAALLDPAFRPLFEDLIDADIMDQKIENRPNDFDADETIKIIVVMTDGANTLQRDLKDSFKNGPSRIWYSSDVAADTGNWYDGYFVEMPDNPESTRWYQPQSPGSTSDGEYYSTADLPDGATGSGAGAMKQKHYVELYQMYSEDDLAKFFFQDHDSTAYNAHRNAVYNYSSYGDTDTRLSDICSAAKDQDGLTIFSIAFEAPAAGRAAMSDCATNSDYYFQVNSSNETSTSGGEAVTIKDAFRAIAGQITQLRLTQ